MKSSLYLVFLLIGLPFFGISQAIFQGNVQPGDTTQMHVLTTKTGDRLVGRVLSADSAQVVFLFKNANQLVFQVAEIERVVVQGMEPVAGSPRVEVAVNAPEKKYAEPGFQYTLYLIKGAPMSGELEGYVAQEFRLGQGTGLDEFVPEKLIGRIELVSPRLDEARELPVKMHFLKTRRGDQFVGQVLGMDTSTLQFLMETGTTLKFPLVVVQSIRLSKLPEKIPSALADLQPIPINGQERLYLSPSAFALEKGVWQLSNYFLFYNTVDYGASEHLMVGASLFTVFTTSMINLRVKYGGSLSEKVHVAAGGQVFATHASFDEDVLGLIGFGTITLGTPERYLNAGVTFISNDPSGESRFTNFNFGGSFRIGKKWRLYGEIHNLQEDYQTEFFRDYSSYWFSVFCASWFNRKHRFDFGLAPIWDEYDVYPVPVFSYSYKFGGREK